MTTNTAMRATIPRWQGAAFDYRCALDVARSVLANAQRTHVISTKPDLLEEARQRFEAPEPSSDFDSCLWIEPRRPTFKDDVSHIHDLLDDRGSIVIIWANPLKRFRRTMRSPMAALSAIPAIRPSRMRRALVDAGFVVTDTYGVHSLSSVLLFRLSTICELVGRPDLGDRWHHRARTRFHAGGPLSGLSAVVILVAFKQES